MKNVSRFAYKTGASVTGALVFAMAFASKVFAQGAFGTTVPTTQNANLDQINSAAVQADVVITNVVAALFVAGLAYFAWGTIKYVMSSTETAKAEAKTQIKYGILGMLVMLGIYGILSAIGAIAGIGFGGVGVAPTI